MQKTKIALLNLTGCSGCEVNLLRLGSAFLDVAQDFEITNWRMLQPEKSADYDIVFVEGYACNEEQVELLKEARATCAVVVALGTCAISGNIFSQLKPEKFKKLNARIYSEKHQTVAQFVRPVPDVIAVEHVVPGCPADIEAVKKLLNELKWQPISSTIREVRPPDYVAKIEGHGRLQVDYQSGTAHFYPLEGERFIEGLVVGKPYLTAPAVHSRICGICPVAHALCSIKAIEKSLKIRPGGVSRRLRRIFQCGQMVQSHLLHLYFMVLPAASGQGSSIDMSLHYPAEFHLCLNIKRVSEEIFDYIGGATLHPVSLTPGGFLKVPEENRLFVLRNKIEEILDEARDMITLLTGFDWPEAVTNGHMLCLHPEHGDAYPLFGNKICCNRPEPFPASRYREFNWEEIINDQPSKKGWLAPHKPIKTGALARLSRYADRLNPLATKALATAAVNFSNPFHNNIAQAVEILHYLEEALLLLDKLISEDLGDALVNRQDIKAEALQQGGSWPQCGVCAIEAPRGLLFHEVQIDKQGQIVSYNIIPPTVLNLSSLDSERGEPFDSRFCRGPNAADCLYAAQAFCKQRDSRPADLCGQSHGHQSNKYLPSPSRGL